ADVVLGLIGVSVLPLVLVVNAVYRRYMSPAITKVQHERARTSDVAHESFEAAAVVKALGTEALEETRFDAVAQDLRASNVAVGKIRSVFDPVIDMLPALATLGVLAVGTIRVSDGLVGSDLARTSDVAHESFEAAAVVKALGTEALEETRFDAVAQDLRASNVAVGKIRSVFDPVIDMLPALATLGVLAVGTIRVSDGLVG